MTSFFTDLEFQIAVESVPEGKKEAPQKTDSASICTVLELETQ